MTSPAIFGLVLAALGPSAPDVYPTDAGDRVYAPGDWPTQPGQYPIIKARLIGEQRVSGARGNLQFTTTAAIRLIAEVSEAASIEDLGRTQIEAKLWRIKRQVEVAVMNSAELWRSIQQITTMRAQFAFDAEGATHLAGIQLDLDVEFFESGEDFDPPDGEPIELIAGHDTNSATGFANCGWSTLVTEDGAVLTDADAGNLTT